MIHAKGGVWKHSAVPWPHVSALMHSQTPTWLNSINPQRSLAIFALMLTLFLHLVLQRHHCVMVAYKKGWTLTGLCPQDFNHSSTTGSDWLCATEAWECRWFNQATETKAKFTHFRALIRVLLTAAAGSRRTQSAAAWLLNQETPLHTRPPPTPPLSLSLLLLLLSLND